MSYGYDDLMRDLTYGRNRGLYERYAPAGLELDVADPSDPLLDILTIREWVQATTDDEDTILGLIGQAVREQGEGYTGRLFSQRQVTATWDQFYVEGQLPFPPVASVASVDRWDPDDEQYASVAAADYVLRGRELRIEDGWPGRPLQVVYTAGYSTIPPTLKVQMLTDIRRVFDHRDGLAWDGESLLIETTMYDRWKVWY